MLDAANPRRDPRLIAFDTAARLTRSGVPGTFVLTVRRVTFAFAWDGSRAHRGEAERALVEALRAERWNADASLPGFGVLLVVPEELLRPVPPPPPSAPRPEFSPAAEAFRAKLDAHPVVRHANARPLTGPSLFDGADPDEQASARRRAARRAA